MAYNQFTFEDRQIIEKMYKSGMTLESIATELGRPITSVYREMKRCPKGEYTAENALFDRNMKHRNTQREGKRVQKENNQRNYVRIIRACLRLVPSATPEQIASAANMTVDQVRQYYNP